MMRPLTPAANSHPAPDTGLAFTEGATVDARVLVITADGTDAAFDAITQTLRYLGTPYDVLNATTGPALTADRARRRRSRQVPGDLPGCRRPVGRRRRARSPTDEWMTLASYEARFGVRRVALYATRATPTVWSSTAAVRSIRRSPITAHCSPRARRCSSGANCAAPVAIDDGWAYPARATDGATMPLLVDDAGNVYARRARIRTAARRWR